MERQKKEKTQMRQDKDKIDYTSRDIVNRACVSVYRFIYLSNIDKCLLF